MESGQSISIAIGGAVTYNSVASRMVHGRIESTTDKAVRVRFDNGQSLWFPRSALTVKSSYFNLAKWFLNKMSNTDWQVLERNQSIGGATV